VGNSEKIGNEMYGVRERALRVSLRVTIEFFISMEVLIRGYRLGPQSSTKCHTMLHRSLFSILAQKWCLSLLKDFRLKMSPSTVLI
jgi:hypothetical protein